MSRLRSGASVPVAALMASTAVRARTRPGGGAHRHAAGRRVDARGAAALVDPRAARQQPLAQPEREPRRMHGRGARHEHAAAEHRRVAARPRLARRSGRHVRAVDGVGADAVLRGRGRHAQLAAAQVPGVDALGLAPGADRVDGLGRGVDPGPRRPRRRSPRAASAGSGRGSTRSRRCGRSGRGRSGPTRAATTRASGAAASTCQAVHSPV